MRHGRDRAPGRAGPVVGDHLVGQGHARPWSSCATGRTAWVEQGRFQGSSDVPLSAHGMAQAVARATRLAAPLAAPPADARGALMAIRHSSLVRRSHGGRHRPRARHARCVVRDDRDAQGAWEASDMTMSWPAGRGSWSGVRPAPPSRPRRRVAVRGLRPGGPRLVTRMLADVGTTHRTAPGPGLGGTPDAGPRRTTRHGCQPRRWRRTTHGPSPWHMTASCA
ncbi:MAG: histidine phosphatase family protein [Chloroflexota bacterium]